MVEQDKCRENQKNGSHFGSRGMSDRRLSPLIEYPEYQNAEYDIANMPAPTAIFFPEPFNKTGRTNGNIR